MSELIPPSPFSILFEEWVAPFPNESRLDMARHFRNGLLNASDWTQAPDASADQQAWAIYRQQLRDFMQTVDPEEPIVFPVAPGFEVTEDV